MSSSTFEDDLSQFRSAFEALTASRPFPWQEDLYLRFFSQGKFPSSCNLATGLGKTSVIAIWLIALARNSERLPRRLVYVVNRRTVVDQTTTQAEKLRANLEAARLWDSLSCMCALPLKSDESPLAISTLRGQFADNREWSSDPARPAIIVGTVDMIGSRLLFSGYGVGFKAKPLHAGFLGQDVLLVHDEAHLEPAFETLLTAIREEQKRCNEFRKFHVLALSATSRSNEDGRAFELTEQENNPPQELPNPPREPVHIVWQRLKAKKGFKLHAVDRSAIAEEIGRLAVRHKASGKAILAFVRHIEDVNGVVRELTNKKDGVPEDRVQKLTGTLRGFERDSLVRENPIFSRFLGQSTTTLGQEAVYLVCTSAGEVGIDISADHMVCDLTPLDSMMQRLGRVNRRGEGKAEVDVVYESEPDTKSKDKPFEKARWKTLELLRKLPLYCCSDDDRLDASPLALRNLEASQQERQAAFTPEPITLPATDILFDSWALTTVRGKLPARPPVEPYLHGLAEWEPPETYVAWRDEVGIITDDLLDLYRPEDLLDDYPLLPHELLRDLSDRVFMQLETLAARHPQSPAWIMDERGGMQTTTMRRLADKARKSAIEDKTVLLPPSVGGLTRDGMLDGKSQKASDIADAAIDEWGRPRRQRVWDDAPIPEGLRIVRVIDTKPDAEDTGSEGGELPRRLWQWCDRPREGGRTANRAITWDEHVGHVVESAKKLVAGIAPPEEIARAVIVAAKLHDRGKMRERFQLALGNPEYPRVILAKSNGRAAARLPESFRHELASALDAENDPEFAKLGAEMQDLVLHLIAAHHGRARPHFDPEEGFDPERPSGNAERLRLETPRRFARLQRKYGRWGLAYLESLLRAADWAASAAEAEDAL